jgi:nucleoside phosphorylase
MSRVAFLFPVQHEAAGVLKKIQNTEKTVLPETTFWRGTFENRDIYIGLLGMGADSVRKSLPILLEQINPDFVWISGFGGGLEEHLKKNDVVLAENFSTEQLSFRHEITRVQGVTVDHVVTSSTQKLALAKAHRASVVDMESAIAHEILEKKQIPHATLRAISDPWNESLPSGALDASFDAEANRPRPFSLLFHLLTHPREAYPFFRFVIELGPVQKNLTHTLLRLESLRSRASSPSF